VFEALIANYGILAVIAGVAIETVVVPIPSPLILMAAGFLLITAEKFSQAFLHSFGISLVAGIAQTIGSYIVYGVAFFGGKPLIDRYEKLHGVSWKEIETFRSKFERGRREELTLFLLRAIPVMPLSVISGVCGIIKMDFKKFTLATFLGTIPRNMFLSLLGWQLAGAYGSLALWINHAETVLTICLAVLIAGYVLAHKFKDLIQKVFF